MFTSLIEQALMNAPVIVVGAGAAGLAAAARLREACVEPLVLEACDRIGGRIWTDYTFAPGPIELGAELIHGEGAATVALAHAAGIALASVDRYNGLRWSDGGPALPLDTLPPAMRATIRGLQATYRELGTVASLPDRSLAAELQARGYGPAALEIAEVLLAQTCCAPLAHLSVADLAREQRADHAGQLEFRLVGGYGPLLDWMARGLRIVLGTPVNAIARRAGSVAVTAAGRTFLAARCIITLPPVLLDTITFDSPLSATKIEAALAFGLEPATKLFFRFDRPYWDEGLAYAAHSGLFSRWWTPLLHLPGAPVICCYVTAERARAVDALDDAELLRRALDELATLTGSPGVRDGCAALRRSAWGPDPLARGGYAYVPPGAADARPTLAAPEGELLFFAGEATAYDTNPQTVHGAIESGRRAAEECLAAA
jgi:monoamine oxidase